MCTTRCNFAYLYHMLLYAHRSSLNILYFINVPSYHIHTYLQKSYGTRVQLFYIMTAMVKQILGLTGWCVVWWCTHVSPTSIRKFFLIFFVVLVNSFFMLYTLYVVLYYYLYTRLRYVYMCVHEPIYHICIYLYSSFIYILIFFLIGFLCL